jgi:hypothetical protein
LCPYDLTSTSWISLPSPSTSTPARVQRRGAVTRAATSPVGGERAFHCDDLKPSSCRHGRSLLGPFRGASLGV